MSGKKASEVNQLLRNGKNARSGAVNMIDSSYKNVIDAEIRMNDAISNAKSTLDSFDFDMSNAEKEFPDAASKIKAELSVIKNQILGLSELAETSELKSEYDRINRDYENTDKKAEKVSSDLKKKIASQNRSDPWYCDDEYRAADAVSREYSALKNRANKLNSRMSSNVNSANQAIARTNKLSEQAGRVISEGMKLDEKAKQAAKLRDDSAKAKKSISDDFNGIDGVIAKKFLSEEYNDLSNKVNSFTLLSDNEVVNAFAGMTSEIRAFSTELDKKYSEFMKRQSEVEALLNSISQRLHIDVFTNPADDFRPGEHKLMNLISFLKGFCADKHVDEISDYYDKAKELFQNENFDEAEEVLISLSKTVDTASEYAAKQHERQKIQLENAIAIRNTMLKMNYDVRSKINKNTDGTVGGYDIICTAGDEEITFENVSVNDEGDFGFGIDHKESSTGTCAGAWQNIRNALAQNNIFIEDITKNESSVLFTNSAAAAKEHKAERSRG